MKKIYLLIVLLISMSLVGIIIMQISAIRNALKLKNEELEQYIQMAVAEVGMEIARSKESISIFGSPKLLPSWPSDQFFQNLRTTVDQRYTPAQIYDKLKKSFNKYGFKNKDFEFAVINRYQGNNIEMQTLNFSKLVADTARNKAFFFPLSEPGGSISGGLEAEEELWVIVPNVRSILLPSLGWMVGGSFLFTLVICTAFFVTVRTMLMQKKLSEIKSDFINNMTHEFKTPLATISLAVDALNNEKVLGSKEKMQYFRGIIKDENKRMNKQVETILQAALLDKEEIQLNMQPINVNEVISNVVENFKLQLEAKNGTIRLTLNARKDLIKADEVHFTNLISNLIDNAVKYSKDDGLHINLSTQNAGNSIRIKIEDNGIGMSRETVARVFEKFYRAHTGNIHNVKGFGLGLSYVKAMVEAQKGKIKVDSALGKGSTFTLEFPLLRKQNAPVAVA